MSIPELLTKIRSAWLERVTHSVADGAGVRENFERQAGWFFDMLVQAVDSGDPSWLDPVLADWVASPTQSELKEGQKNTTAVLNQMLTLTLEVARQSLDSAQALALVSSTLPYFIHALDHAARREMEMRVAYFSNELSTMQQKLERLDRSKSGFIAVAAHELKTPLTLIEGYTAMMTELVRKVQGDSQIDQLLDGVENGIHRLRAIVDDMIDVSMIDNNLLSLNFQPVWLNQFFALLRDELAPSLSERHQALTVVAFPGSEQAMLADPERLYQAFRNLLLNAIKYTPDGGSITVDGRSLPGFIEVTIADTGIGIPSENQEAIFEKFGQQGNTLLHSSSKTKFKGGGPGLGLPITKGIITA
ncbi:MAG: HAMP domain-containing histidine kinase, partial [Chloroflexi bacterium]|nr:HAMP domain-containing histidine kinase [Chloroflexota bacterium]